MLRAPMRMLRCISSLAVLGTLLLGTVGCEPTEPGGGEPLPTGPHENSSGAEQPLEIGPVIIAERWIPAPLAVDPFPEHQPSEPWECKLGAYRVERGSFEVETGSCGYGLFAQPLLAPVRAGETLRMVAWHLVLSNPEPAFGHMALFLGDEMIFEVSPAIPGPAASYDRELVMKKDHPPGEPVILHIHNHGINNWNLLSLETTGR